MPRASHILMYLERFMPPSYCAFPASSLLDFVLRLAEIDHFAQVLTIVVIKCRGPCTLNPNTAPQPPRTEDHIHSKKEGNGCGKYIGENIDAQELCGVLESFGKVHDSCSPLSEKQIRVSRLSFNYMIAPQT